MRTTILASVLLVLIVCASPLVAQFAFLSPDQQDTHLATVVIEAARRGPATPIPLLADGSRALGAFYDRFHIGVLLARAQMATNQPLDSAAVIASPLWKSRAVAVVAYPINCAGQPNQPLAIRVTGSMGPISPTPLGEPVRGAAAESLLPGISLPGDALVQSFRNVPILGGGIEIDYAGPACRGAATTVTLPLGTFPSKSLLTGLLGVKLPAELASVPTPATVRMQVLLDVDGRVRFAQQVQGPVELGPAATAVLQQRRFDPWAINGVAVPQWTNTTLVFTATGAPAQPDPFRPPTGPGTVVSGNPVMVEVNPRLAAPPLPGTRPPVRSAPPGESDTHLAQLAIERAQKGNPTPISLDPAGPPVHGVLFDRFLVAVLRARAAVSAGTPMDPATVSPLLLRNDAVAVAFPLACPAGAVAPTDVRISAGGNINQREELLSGPTLAVRLPGVVFPEGAVGRSVASAPFGQNLEVRITYADRACPGESNTVTLPIQFVRGMSIGRLPTAKLPPDASSLPSPTTVVVRGLVDLDGRYRFPTLAEGPPELAAAAVALAANWRFQPYRVNGAPTPTFVLTPLTFTATGMPAPPTTPGPGVSAMPPTAMTNSTVGGRPAMINSADVPGLNAATSKCAIADDDYGFTQATAIKVGGGPREGPALERRYLSALRGPNGEGLRATRLGTTVGSDGTILDMYEVTYSGLAQPVRLFLDEYHDEPRKAPKGFTCADDLRGHFTNFVK